MRAGLACTFALALSIPLAACSRSTPVEANGPTTQAAKAPATAPIATPPAGELPHVDGNKAMQYVKEVVAFGPRPVGSAAHAKLEDYLRTRIKKVAAEEEDAFTASTPAGPLAMRNFIAKFPGTKDGVVVIATHYDTLYGRKDFVGANDGGSGTGLLLAMADLLHEESAKAGKTHQAGVRDGYSVWLVWLDGEEAIQEWSETDSVYGGRHLAAKWQQDGTIKSIKGFLLEDMIGDADLNVDRDANSTPWLEDVVYEAAKQYGYQSRFFARTVGMDDDHRPFREAGLPVADLIDFDYGYDNAFWHAPEDTLDKLSPKSLEIVGSVTLETVRYLDQR